MARRPVEINDATKPIRPRDVRETLRVVIAWIRRRCGRYDGPSGWHDTVPYSRIYGREKSSLAARRRESWRALAGCSVVGWVAIGRAVFGGEGSRGRSPCLGGDANAAVGEWPRWRWTGSSEASVPIDACDELVLPLRLPWRPGAGPRAVPGPPRSGRHS